MKWTSGTRVYTGLPSQTRTVSALNQSSEVPSALNRPQVWMAPMGRSPTPAHSSSVVVPNSRMRWNSAGVPGPKSMFVVPKSYTTLSGPSSRQTSIILSAICVSASSQEMRSHLPDPRSPTRRSGYLMRVGSYIRSL